MKRSVISLGLVFGLAVMSGCSSISQQLPPMERVVSIAKESAKEPATWGPLAAAAAIGVAGKDNDISEWASDNTPVFGSQRRASAYSDAMRDSLVAGMVLTSLFAPNPNGDKNAFPTRRVATNALAIGTVQGVIEVGKRTFERQRPNARDDRSFPSGHSSGSFASAYLIEKNLNATVEQPWLRKTIKVGALSSAASVAWARVEAEEHHAVDVLLSAGLSNFFVQTIYRSLMSEEHAATTSFNVEAHREGFMLRLSHAF